jgi:hypothetical protein
MKVMIALAVVICVASASSVDARTYYGGGHHTSSHGGSYRGGSSGSSHKGGHYSSPRGGHSYGRHK